MCCFAAAWAPTCATLTGTSRKKDSKVVHASVKNTWVWHGMAAFQSLDESGRMADSRSATPGPLEKTRKPATFLGAPLPLQMNPDQTTTGQCYL